MLSSIQNVLPPQSSPELSFIFSFFEKAAVIFRHHYLTALTKFETKSDATPVTLADTGINDLLIKMVEQHYPTHSIDGEESSLKKDSPYTWVCDPIDGTVPYTDGIPISVISVALTKEGKTIVAAVYEVHSERITCAELGKGTYCNGKKIMVHRHKLGEDLRSGIIFDSWPAESYAIVEPVTQLGIATNSYIRSFGCAVAGALMVVRGLAAVHVFSGGAEKHVDTAATSLLVTEAGGKATDLFGNEQRYDGVVPVRGSILSNGVVHDVAVSYLKNSKKLRD
jgi:fructose-1,6-bisphosphatase/inositol monophosphatase family enzyme